MASKSKKKSGEKSPEIIEAKETEVVESEVVEPTPEEAPAVETVEAIETPTPPRPQVNVAIYRDDEGRLVFAEEGKPKRIAGSDDAFPEVARQFASDFIKERQI